MNDKELQSPAEIKSLLEGTQSVTLAIDKEKRYAWIAYTLKKTGYLRLKKKEKAIVFAYMIQVSHYSRSQLSDLIKQHKIKKCIARKSNNRTQFSKHYTQQDIMLLITTDKEHENLSGLLTKKLFERAYKIFDDSRYQRLSSISSAHIYNLRSGDFYKRQRQRQHFEKTKRSKVMIGVRQKPQPDGEPGYLRIDTVHQGDLDKIKGVYHINAVDEVTQFEVICSGNYSYSCC